MEKLKNYSENTMSVVHHSEINIGDVFQDGYNSVEKKPIYKMVTNIHEQRLEKGVYQDESLRRMWAKVDVVKTEKQIS